jgi:PadR family transcriptional regulator, regulatory protein PadR
MPTRPRSGLLQGTLDLLILRTLLYGPVHGHGIAKHIQRTSEDALLVDHGSLYPALHRLEKNGCISSKWEQTEHGRDTRRYRLTAKGRRQLSVEESKWKTLARAMARMLKPT